MADGLIDPKRIDDAPIEKGSSAPASKANDPFTRDPILDQKMGLLGRLFGYGEEKRGNLAFLAAVSSGSMLLLCLFAPLISADETFRETAKMLVAPLVGIASGAIGYATGQRSDPS